MGARLPRPGQCEIPGCGLAPDKRGRWEGQYRLTWLCSLHSWRVFAWGSPCADIPVSGDEVADEVFEAAGYVRTAYSVKPERCEFADCPRPPSVRRRWEGQPDLTWLCSEHNRCLKMHGWPCVVVPADDELVLHLARLVGVPFGFQWADRVAD